MEAETAGGGKAPPRARKPKPDMAVPSRKSLEVLGGNNKLIGSIVEKGFSSAVNPPQPSVLPFPVARHRSHGPHWGPPAANAKMDVDEGEMEDDKDELDYDPLSSFANPLVKKEKKGLDFKRWREIVSEKSPDSPQPKKITSTKRISTAETSTEIAPKAVHMPVKNRESVTSNMDVDIREELHEAEGPSSVMDDIDTENLVKLQRMSPEEIAEAQAEIMEKMDPSLVDMLKKRGRDKLGNRKSVRREGPVVEKKSSAVNLAAGDSVPAGVYDNRSWKKWSERVEKVRGLRFTLEGEVVAIEEEQHVGNQSGGAQCNVNNVAERDFLRTEGDPAGFGYTINEAVALTRSMVPGQRSLALNLLATVLSKALFNLQKKSLDLNKKQTSSIANIVDWQAVWAFAVGPEPELVLSLRIALDDNHDSVVLACAKVIQCLLSCDLNETFFNTLEKLPVHGNSICTAAIFRSRPEIDSGFLRGGFWKYSAKPSNLLPSSDVNEDENDDDQHTIQDDVVVSGQDVAAGLIRMGILPRICYLLEMDPLPPLEDCLLLVLIALARHSRTSANAIMRCPRLIEAVLKLFTRQGKIEVHPSQIRAVMLLKVLSMSSRQICIDIVKHGAFQQSMWHWYKPIFSLESWVISGREHCKLTSALMVEQLRFWRICIQYGYCTSYYTDLFPAMCMWLSPPTFDKLIENNVLVEFASVTREAYLVLELLAQSLPCLHSTAQPSNQSMGISEHMAEAWSWNHVPPLVDIAINWLSLKNIPYVFSVIAGQKSENSVEVACLSSMIWLISAVLRTLSCILKKIAPEETTGIEKYPADLPWLPHFVPRIGLEVVKNGFLNFSDSKEKMVDMSTLKDASLVDVLCHLREKSDPELSLASVCCLYGLVQLIHSVDESVRRAKSSINYQLREGFMSSEADKLLEEGIIASAQEDLLKVLNFFLSMVSSEWQLVQSIETFGRGGPAPGVGVGWGSPGGGFWSTDILLAQMDAQLFLNMVEIFAVVVKEDALLEDRKPATDISTDSMLRASLRINGLCAVCLLAGPMGRSALRKALDILLQAPILKYLNDCLNYFRTSNGLRSFDWHWREEDLVFLSNKLIQHYKDRWLSSKRKSSDKLDSDNHEQHSSIKIAALETIHEDIETPEGAVEHPSSTPLLLEWVHQRLPLPVHWFLSAVSTIGDPKNVCSPSASNVDVAKGGLFLLLCLEAVSWFIRSELQLCTISSVPLVWKLHALSMTLYSNMDVLGDQRSRDLFEALQDLYGQNLDKLRCSHLETISRDNKQLSSSVTTLADTFNIGRLEYLDFQSQIHESYTTFVENLIEQFGATSYGDIIYGRQVAMYLHQAVEATLRLAVWNALSSAHVLELLPLLEHCIGKADGYLGPVEENEGILEAYAKTWTSGALDRAASRGSMTFTLAMHHLSCFIFKSGTCKNTTLRNKLVKSLMRSNSQKQNQEVMLSKLIRYQLPHTLNLQRTEVERRFELLKEACQGNSSLVAEVEKLKCSFYG